VLVRTVLCDGSGISILDPRQRLQFGGAGPVNIDRGRRPLNVGAVCTMPSGGSSRCTRTARKGQCGDNDNQRHRYLSHIMNQYSPSISVNYITANPAKQAVIDCSWAAP